MNRRECIQCGTVGAIVGAIALSCATTQNPPGGGAISASAVPRDGTTEGDPMSEANETLTALRASSVEGEAHIMGLEATGSGPVVVLVGGGLTGALSWAPHAEKLAPRREVARAQPLGVQFALDARPLPSGYGVRTESTALLRALDARGWREPVDLVGWSYGGLIALDLALEHPERVRSLTLVEPSSFWVLPDHGRAHPEIRELEALSRK